MRVLARRGAIATVATAALTAGAVATGLGVPSGLAAPAPHPASGASPCHLDNGVQHVINITFDNVHFFRDNPNVPSDLEQMPTLYKFLQDNGTVLSNMHTPLIAHTAEDSLAIYSGLYGDRHGQPVSNSYKTYKPDGTTESDTSFTYWTSPVITTGSQQSTNDTKPSMIYSATVPASTSGQPQPAPEPWVAFNKAGCSVGAFSTANMVLENAGDIPQKLPGQTRDTSKYATDNLAFLGEAIHCGVGDSSCSGQAHAVTDTPPPANDPGTATYSALFGHQNIAPFITSNAHAPDGYRVADNAGNLVDLDNREIADFLFRPGFPGFSPTASQSLAEIADMQEAGVPVTYGYISDMHEVKNESYNCTTAGATSFGKALGPGDACYVDTARRYDAAFGKFLDRLAKDGITAKNTLFVIGSEENDHFAGANVGRADAPKDPANCDGVTTPCRYGAGQVGEVQANLPGMLAAEKNNHTPFVVEPQGASIYVTNPAAQPVSPPGTDPAVRQLERDTAALTANNPHSGVQGETLVNYQAGDVEQRILHMQTADPQRTPTYTVFPKPDYYFDNANPPCTNPPTPQAPCVTVNSGFAWNHGYYSPDIAITWSSFVGPGIAKHGVDGPKPADSPAVKDPTGGGLVPDFSKVGTWADEADVRPTMLSVVGLTDDYVMDGRVITQVLNGNGQLGQTADLGACYKQLNASVGTFGTDTLLASTAALASGSGGNDSTFTNTNTALGSLADRRDALATDIKNNLDGVEFHGAHPDNRAISAQLDSCRKLIGDAAALAQSTSGRSTGGAFLAKKN
jgi:hypothetical protein